ncbi:YgaP family membrane protein [Caldisericum exile]|uniref:Inner membrane protein YgaP-like transmembrane domain-containing protein n=1 Tax=Caldisericum exile (strain DSM 21853 / NBRC 104410 / AZM16c01) TaxID=511051 RepID=A0A7U6GD67_CALEA|nr:DUF2892 domain-containing protein [Caldisericum exile]BAL80142.1 hypothetical protein CSE_00160 [Caldisericum exile AZM16c01]
MKGCPVPNEGNVDRIIRIIIGVVLILLSVFAQINPTLKVIFIIIGVIALITGLTGFCLAYKLLGISTRK